MERQWANHPSDASSGPPKVRAGAPAHAASARRYELDWLRVLAVFGLIPFHVAIIFSLGGGDYVKNAERSVILGQLATFVTFWGIPLLFFVSGASNWFALQGRAPGIWVRDRIRRLLVPFAFGVFAIVPVQVYFGRLSDPHFHESYVDFYTRFFLAFQLDRAGDYWAHLWFVPCLLAFSIIALPLFNMLRHPAGRRVIAALGQAFEHRGTTLLLALPLGASDVLLRGHPVATLFTTYLHFDSWALFAFFLIFFIYGYGLYADARILQAIKRDGPLALALGVIFWFIAQQLVATHALPSYEYSLTFVVAMFVRGCVSWFWIVAIVSLGLKALTFNNGLLRYLDEAFYPVYVLHMPVLTIVGFYVVRTNLSEWGKFAIIIVATLMITLAIYDLLIRRIPVMRFLFGLKPLPLKPADSTRVEHERAIEARVPMPDQRRERSNP